MSSEAEILAKACKVLVGRTIVAVGYMEHEEREEFGWNKRGPVLTLDNGAQIIPMSDDEGNESGVLVVAHPDSEEALHLGSL